MVILIGRTGKSTALAAVALTEAVAGVTGADATMGAGPSPPAEAGHIGNHEMIEVQRVRGAGAS